MNHYDLFKAIVTGLVLQYFNESNNRSSWHANPYDWDNYTHYLQDTLTKLAPCINGKLPYCGASFFDVQCVWASEIANICRKLNAN